MEANPKTSRSASLAAIGEKLRKAREAKSLKIDQVQKKTRIHATVIIALEEGNCESLMSATYAKSFLRTYAAFLGLDTEDVMKDYSAARPQQQYSSSPQAMAPQPSEEKDGKTDIFLRLIYVMSFVLLLAVVLFFANAAWKKVSSGIKKSRSARSVPSKTSRKTPPDAASAKDVRKDLKGAAFTSIYIPKKEKIKLVLKIKQPVRVEVRLDGTLLLDKVMPKGMVETYVADTKLNLYIAKAEAVDMTVNGRSFGSPGRGVIKDLEITRNGIRIK